MKIMMSRRVHAFNGRWGNEALISHIVHKSILFLGETNFP